MLTELLSKFHNLTGLEIIFLILGFIGQICFFMRFLIQWIASEKRKASYIPIAFWYLSILGSWLLLTYAISKRDPVFILGTSVNSIVYIRNLILIHKNKKEGAERSNS